MENHAQLIDYYEKKLRQHHGGALAVDWNCQEAQELLFFALLDGLDEAHLHSGKVRILDIGCGLGALYGFLCRQGYRVDYTGIDIAPGMVEAAKQSYPEANFEVRDILENPYEADSFDYVFLSGSISIKIANHERYARRMIYRMFSFARVALCFNVLSGRSLPECRAFQMDSLRYYPQPPAILDFCHSLTPLVNLRHDVAGWTFTMQLFKRQDICPRVINNYVAYLEKEGTAEADSAIANTLMEVGAIQRTLDRVPIKSENADYLNFRAVCLARLGKREGQVAALKKALELVPDHNWAQLNLGTVAHADNDLATAKDAYCQVLSRMPDNNVARSQLFFIYLREKNLTAAWDLLGGFTEIVERHYFTGEYYYLTGEYQQAYKFYCKANSRAAYLAEACRKMALCSSALGNEHQACNNWLKVHRMLPYDQQAVSWLANYYFEHGRYKKVLSLLENSVCNNTLGVLRGRAFYSLGRKKQAREAWRENVTDTGSISSLLDLAELDIEEGRWQEGASYLALAADMPEAKQESWARRIWELTHKVATGSGHCEQKGE